MRPFLSSSSIVSSAFAFAFATLCVASPARAQPAVGDAPAEQKTHVRRYWGLTLGADAVSVGVMAVGAALEGEGGRDTPASTGFITAGLIGASFGAPVIHAIHGNWRGAGLSLLVRAAIPSITISVAMATAECDDLLCELDSMVPGYLVGLGIASVVDAGLLARQERPPPVRSPAWSPVVSLRPGGGQFGIAATF
jgi:hypothetical protein